MDSENRSKEDIERKLDKLQKIRRGYITFYVIVILNLFVYKHIDQIFSVQFSGTVGFGWYNFITSFTFLFVRIYAELYLLKMVLKMQELFRQHGHIKGNESVMFIFATYFLYFGGIIYQFIYKPSVMLRINTSDYECT